MRALLLSILLVFVVTPAVGDDMDQIPRDAARAVERVFGGKPDPEADRRVADWAKGEFIDCATKEALAMAGPQNPIDLVVSTAMDLCKSQAVVAADLLGNTVTRLRAEVQPLLVKQILISKR